MVKQAKGRKKAFSFEAAMERLEVIVDGLEAGESSLENSLQTFEEGVGLVKQCRDYLDASRKRVEVLLGEDEQGKPVIDVYEEDVDEGGDHEEEE